MSRHGVMVPADVDLADKVLWGLTVRQVAILAPVGLGLLGVWKALLGTVPILVLLVISALVAAAAVAMALLRLDGVSLDRIVWAALRRPRGRVAAGEPRAPAAQTVRQLVGNRPDATPPRAVQGPVRALTSEGVVDLGPAGHAIGLDVGFVNFTLRSGGERAALVAAAARWLNATDAHIQITVSSRPVDLTDYLDALGERCEALGEGRLGQAAAGHHAWLARLTASRQLLRREITVVVVAGSPESADYAAVGVEAAAQSMGVHARRLDAAALAARTRYALDPFGTATAHTATGKESS